MKNRNLQTGFTIVEILVVIAIVAIVGTMLVAIFADTLRGSSKSQILGVIKQNGQAVLENMDKTIRGADKVVCLSSDSKILVLEKDGAYTRFRFAEPTSTINGYIKQDNPFKEDNLSTGELETDGEFSDRACDIDTIDIQMTSSTQVVTLTDTNTRSGVSVEPVEGVPFITRNKAEGFNDSVTVSFDLSPGVSVPTALTGQIDSVTFQTTVQLR